MVISDPGHWMEDYKFKGPKYDKIVEIIAAINAMPGSLDHGGLLGLADDDHAQYFKVTGRTNEDLTLSGTGKIDSADGDYVHTLARAKIGFIAGFAADACYAHRDQFSALAYAIRQDQDGNTYLNARTGKYITFEKDAVDILRLDDTGLSFIAAGTTVNEFSTDGALAGNSDLALPTEKAVKTYIDAFEHGNLVGLADDDHAHYFKVIGRTNEDLTLSGTGTISSTDGDYYHLLSKAFIGYNGSFGDDACFGHRDMRSPIFYALRQDQDGNTYINARTGKWITFEKQGVDVLRLDDDGLKFLTTTHRLRLPYLTGVPAGVDNGSIWMESDGLHIYYAGAEKVVAGV